MRRRHSRDVEIVFILRADDSVEDLNADQHRLLLWTKKDFARERESLHGSGCTARISRSLWHRSVALPIDPALRSEKSRRVFATVLLVAQQLVPSSLNCGVHSDAIEAKLAQLGLCFSRNIAGKTT